jgi:hypothetical protein
VRVGWPGGVGSDTCLLPLQEYLQNPINTTLDVLHPCAILAVANHTYVEARIGIDSVIRIVCLLGFFPFYFA